MEGKDGSFHVVIPLDCQDTLLYCSLVFILLRFGVILASLFLRQIPISVQLRFYMVTVFMHFRFCAATAFVQLRLLCSYGLYAIMYYCVPSLEYYYYPPARANG